jgi:uncharacterized protein
MRRKDREITSLEEMEAIIGSQTVCTVGLVDGSRPFLLPMSYGYRDGCFYLHSARTGRKLDILKNNPAISILVCGPVIPLPAEEACGHSVSYRSVVCEGDAELLSDPAEKAAALQVIMASQTGREDWEISEASLSTVAVIRVKAAAMSGKKKEPPVAAAEPVPR